MRTGRATARTDVGRRRTSNEDAYVCDPPLFAVADGMGGAQAGEVASGIAAAALEAGARRLRGEEAVAALIREANTRIHERSHADPATAGMGTTVTVAVLDGAGGTLALGHVGDSRAYRIRGDRLEQLTADHSVVAELVRTGRLAPEEADRHPLRSAITRALGTEPTVDVDTLTVAAEPGDLYLLCSDGLTTMVDDDEILALADGAQRDPAHTAAALVEAANRAGGEDNVTVVLFEVEDGEPEAVEAEPEAPAAPAPAVRRHGAGAGGRGTALAAIVLAVVIAALLLWWGIAH